MSKKTIRSQALAFALCTTLIPTHLDAMEKKTITAWRPSTKTVIIAGGIVGGALLTLGAKKIFDSRQKAAAQKNKGAMAELGELLATMPDPSQNAIGDQSQYDTPSSSRLAAELGSRQGTHMAPPCADTLGDKSRFDASSLLVGAKYAPEHKAGTPETKLQNFASGCAGIAASTSDGHSSTYDTPSGSMLAVGLCSLGGAGAGAGAGGDAADMDQIVQKDAKKQ